MKKADRQKIQDKFGGLCAYSGTALESDWQPDHIKPVLRCSFTGKMINPENDNIDNMIPCQSAINHYKGALDIETFRSWYVAGLHDRLKKLPKNPKTKKSMRRKEYMLRIAGYFGITEDKPFSGIFYFETLNIT